MRKIYVFTLLISFVIPSFGGGANDIQTYSVPKSPWAESLGNHRAILEISDPSDAITLDLAWRRHDKDPEKRRLMIISAGTGDTIANICRHQINNEKCRITFGPVNRKGTYYFYYLPYEVQKEYGNYNKNYLKPEHAPSDKWVIKNHLNKNSRPNNSNTLKVIEIQSRSSFDSFYPMEVTALASEKRSLISKSGKNYLIFPEDRSNPIRMKDHLPFRWIGKGPSGKFNGVAFQNEYYAFQLGVFAAKNDLANIKVEFTDLNGDLTKIPAAAITCFNTGGTDPYGKQFTRKVDISRGGIQPLWIGVDIPETIPAGIYKGGIRVIPENDLPQTVEVILQIENKVLEDRGDSEPWRHSRLRWLNSTLGIDEQPTKQYDPIKSLSNSTYRLTNKELKMNAGEFPESIKVEETEILSNRVSFIIETKKGLEEFSLAQNVRLLKNSPGFMTKAWQANSTNFSISGVSTLESDGYINYKIQLNAIMEISVNDIRLELPFSGNTAQYMMGMGLPGILVPQSHQAKWRGPYDSFWVGNTHAGLWCELRGSSYNGPLLNLYNPAPPSSWYNNDKGGFRIEKGPLTTKAIVYSGVRNFKKGESIDFEWSMLITPVKKLNPKSQFTDRYYHNGGNPMPSDSDLSCGVKIVNLHHANNYNPHINYPFIAVDSMKWFVNKLHERGQKVKIYYTIRELTNYTSEIWALRSLGNEILGEGSGGGYPWLREHLIDGYQPQWYQYFPDKSADASIVNAPGDSRWYNYYIEGLAWLVKNVDIDGLYLDDVSYDRRTVKRIRKVLDNLKPGCLLDLHSNTGFSKGPANQYAEYFPYIDKIWFGESFRYDEIPAPNWLVEVSGIPFGLMGDMLQGGGNRWRGMVYGMTVRHPWTTETVRCDPRPVWKIWDEFGISNSIMKGYWEKDCPVSASDPDIHATIYQKGETALISVASWNSRPISFSLRFDWKTLGIDSTNTVLFAPEIKDFQKEAIFKPSDLIPVEPTKGWLLYLRKKSN